MFLAQKDRVTYVEPADDIVISEDQVGLSLVPEVEQLVDRYNAVCGTRQQVLQKLKDVRYERHSIEQEIAILRDAVSELVHATFPNRQSEPATSRNR